MNETTEMKGINSSEDTNSDCLRTRQGGRARMQRIGSGGDYYKGSWENLPAMGEFFILIMIMVSYMPCNVGQLYLSKYVHRMFIAALFTIAKIWKQPNRLLSWWVDETTMGHLHNGILLGHKKENFTLCSRMDEPGEHYAKWNKPVRERQIPYNLTYMWNSMNKLN